MLNVPLQYHSSCAAFFGHKKYRKGSLANLHLNPPKSIRTVKLKCTFTLYHFFNYCILGKQNYHQKIMTRAARLPELIEKKEPLLTKQRQERVLFIFLSNKKKRKRERRNPICQGNPGKDPHRPLYNTKYNNAIISNTATGFEL